jgi:hypothetical protein
MPVENARVSLLVIEKHKGCLLPVSDKVINRAERDQIIVSTNNDAQGIPIERGVLRRR